MLIKFMIALVIGFILTSYPEISSKSIRNSISDQTIETNAVILDNAIVAYYCNHHGTLPNALNKDFLVVMGLEDMDISNYTYSKTSDRQFILTAKLSKSTLTTTHSNQNLVIPVEVK